MGDDDDLTCRANTVAPTIKQSLDYGDVEDILVVNANLQQPPKRKLRRPAGRKQEESRKEV